MAEPLSRFRVAERTNRWSYLPGGRAFLRWNPDHFLFRVAEPAYGRSHNLYTKYLETGRFTRELKPLFTTQLYNMRWHLHSSRGYTTMTPLHYKATLSSPSRDLLCHGMARGRGTPLFIGLHGSFCVVMCPPYTLLYISRVFSIFLLSYNYLFSWEFYTSPWNLITITHTCSPLF